MENPNPSLMLSDWSAPESLRSCLIFFLAPVAAWTAQAGTPSPLNAPPAFQKYCFECHGASKPKGDISLEKLLAAGSIAAHPDAWDKVAEMLETAEMPPADAKDLPSDTERAAAAAWVRTALKAYTAAHAGEPGRVTVRRLTSGEYAYAIRDLTGIDLKVGIDASSDSVGGEGFTNFGDVQFVQDSSVERYLEAAKHVAAHAVIGSGPLQFYPDPGRTGLELSALNRINALHAANGFRVVSGEGGRPFGLERYGKAFYAAWYYRHRAALGDPRATLRDLAAKEGITGRFAEHIWAVANRRDLGYPSREMIARWHALPAPTSNRQSSLDQARAGCEELSKYLTTWPSWFFARGDLALGGLGDESPLVFNDTSLKVVPTHHYTYAAGGGGGRGGRSATPPPAPGSALKVVLAFTNLNPSPGVNPVIIWRNPRVIVRARSSSPRNAADGDTTAAAPPATGGGRFRGGMATMLSTQSLRSVLPADTAAAFAFGQSPDGTEIGPDDFATTGTVSFELRMPAEGFLEFQVDAALGQDKNAVVRLMLSDGSEGGVSRGARLNRIVLGDAASAGYRTFRAGMAEYVSLLPPNSHGEANPADKDPVPLPFDSTFNSAEHDAFVLKVKYQRNDAFLTENLVDGADRARLNHAWNDLFGAWPYHDAYLGMLVEHYGLKLKSTRIQDVSAADLAALPEDARPHFVALRAEYQEVTKALAAAQPGHVEDALAFASRAWRRPLTSAEKTKLRDFYQRARRELALEHDDAIRAVLARILVSPAFLYRVETVAGRSEQALGDWELASRLSFFLWSTVPDEELRRAAGAGELRQPALLAKQVKRMTADPKARRLATEFFGQWLGFYQFDGFRGVDTTRFPEFTDEVKSAMYDEAVSTFEYLVRAERPLKEMLHADYTFLNQPLAKFYGLQKEVKSSDAVEKVDGAPGFNRGGALRLGAVLTLTSGPLRTSPVKRGDWLLRRIIGTPTPPPPADAGSLPADPKAFGGLTLRQRLDEHKRNATCANCHLRIDPLGFPLEGFDPIGRTRTAYPDGTALDLTGEFSDKSTIVGTTDLLDYLQRKEPQVMKTLARKMLGYALGRTVQASDRALLDELTSAGGNATFSDLAVKIVNSRQFRHRQGQDEDGAAPSQ